MHCFANSEDWAVFRPLLWVQGSDVISPQAQGSSLPLKLNPEIPTRLLPLSLPFVALAAVSALWFLHAKSIHNSNFQELVKLLEYVVVLYESATPSTWMRRRPDALLDFPPPASRLEWNSATRIWAGPDPPSPFSTSPPLFSCCCFARSVTNNNAIHSRRPLYSLHSSFFALFVSVVGRARSRLR